MKTLKQLFDNNRRWAEKVNARDPEFFAELAKQQTPQYFWIGCSDSRVPANEIIDLRPGEVFVHRNIANLVQHSDMNCLSVLQFAVDVLKVRHVMVTGHYGCGGVRAALEDQRHGLVDNWLRPIQHVCHDHAASLDSLEGDARLDRMCELNVVQQVDNLRRTTIVQDAWARGQALDIHGWIYSVRDGLLRDLDVTVSA
ncbi:MAG TPA: carbonate dehydratase [Gammaproteobacteria bacterium]